MLNKHSLHINGNKRLIQSVFVKSDIMKGGGGGLAFEDIKTNGWDSGHVYETKGDDFAQKLGFCGGKST